MHERVELFDVPEHGADTRRRQQLSLRWPRRVDAQLAHVTKEIQHQLPNLLGRIGQRCSRDVALAEEVVEDHEPVDPLKHGRPGQ